MPAVTHRPAGIVGRRGETGPEYGRSGGGARPRIVITEFKPSSWPYRIRCLVHVHTISGGRSCEPFVRTRVRVCINSILPQSSRRVAKINRWAHTHFRVGQSLVGSVVKSKRFFFFFFLISLEPITSPNTRYLRVQCPPNFVFIVLNRRKIILKLVF